MVVLNGLDAVREALVCHSEDTADRPPMPIYEHLGFGPHSQGKRRVGADRGLAGTGPAVTQAPAGPRRAGSWTCSAGKRQQMWRGGRRRKELMPTAWVGRGRMRVGPDQDGWAQGSWEQGQEVRVGGNEEVEVSVGEAGGGPGLSLTAKESRWAEQQSGASTCPQRASKAGRQSDLSPAGSGCQSGSESMGVGGKVGVGWRGPGL